MTVIIAHELWGELKRYVNTVDREEAAETVVSVLIDNDVDPEDIKNTFKGDADIKHALTQYLHDDSEPEIEEDEDIDEDYDEDENWEN